MVSVTEKVAWPFELVTPLKIVIFESPPLLWVSVTVFPATGLPLASTSVTVIVDDEVPSAGSDVGQATTVDFAGEGTVVEVKVTRGVDVKVMPSEESFAV